ncbi:MAG: hypothetical protein LBR18_00760 [Tannerella sp.]|nr:hypothetical protein [Tannerella sp.]
MEKMFAEGQVSSFKKQYNHIVDKFSSEDELARLDSFSDKMIKRSMSDSDKNMERIRLGFQIFDDKVSESHIKLHKIA